MSDIVSLIVVLLFFGGMIFIYKFVTKDKTKVEKYKIKTFLLLMLSIMIFVLIITYLFLTNFEESDTLEMTEDYSISEYVIKINVSENNVATVEEDITVDFLNNEQHGIYRILPRWLKYTGKDGKTISRRYDLDNIDVVDDNYRVDSLDAGKEKIIIGDDNKLLPVGEKTYIIKYQYNMGKDPYTGYDEFIFHAFGDYWNAPIKNASVEITMPNEFDGNVKLFLDKYRKNDVTEKFDYTIHDNKITISAPGGFELTKSLTIDVILPDEYFKNTENTYGGVSLILLTLILFIFIVILIKWFRFGRDYKANGISVESLIREYDAASIGYIYKQDAGSRILIATIIELSNLHALKVIDEEKKIILVNLKTKNVNMTSNQKIVYDNIFANEDEVALSDIDYFKIFKELNNNLRDNLEEVIDDTESYRNQFRAFLYTNIGGFFWIWSYSSFNDLEPKYNYLFVVAFILLVLSFVFSLLMKRRNERGVELYNGVVSLKKYLKNISKDDMKKVKKFDDLTKNVSYAYVLGVYNKYLEKLDGIVPNGDDYFLYSSTVINDMGNTSYTSGGCSSCGGGGGCSSCGGGGSW